MNDIKFNCLSCDGSLVVEATGAGRIVSCPKCGCQIQIPTPPKGIGATPQIPEINLTQIKESATPDCPLCRTPLDKMPGRKKKCPACAKFIFVRTRPQDRLRVLVGEQGAMLIDEQWQSEMADDASRLDARRIVEQERRILSERYGASVATGAGCERALHSELAKHAKDGNWGLFRNTTLILGCLAEKEGNPCDAVRRYLEVCFFDANGCSNNAEIDGAFNTEFAELTPLVVATVKTMMAAAKVSLSEAESFFKSIYTKYHKLRPPVGAAETWRRIIEEMAGQ